MSFFDRVDAGRRLAERLAYLRDQDVVVLGLPRGGVPVAFEVAQTLGAELDVVVVRKLGVPYQPELGMGAVGEGGVRILNDEVIRQARVGPEELAVVEQREREVLNRRATSFRGDRPRLPLSGRTAVIVDDGIATGSTARAACEVVRAQGAARIVLATPVAPPGSVEALQDAADEVVCLETPQVFFAIGEFYDDFSQVPDREVVALLERAAARTRDLPPRQRGGPAAAPPTGGEPAAVDEEVDLDVDGVLLQGHLAVPAGASAIVAFAHGSGSSRHSPRNRYVASVLGGAGLGTLLFDLLTVDEEADRANVFDIGLLATRLSAATRWLRARPGLQQLRVGFFGASTGAAAALWAAADLGDQVHAVVSRGGRPDLAGPRLGEVRAPTLLIVGGLDDVVLELNQQAQRMLRCENRLAVVPGATHLFEETGTLQAAAGLARDWFVEHLLPPVPAEGAGTARTPRSGR